MRLLGNKPHLAAVVYTSLIPPWKYWHPTCLAILHYSMTNLSFGPSTESVLVVRGLRVSFLLSSLVLSVVSVVSVCWIRNPVQNLTLFSLTHEWDTMCVVFLFFICLSACPKVWLMNLRLRPGLFWPLVTQVSKPLILRNAAFPRSPWCVWAKGKPSNKQSVLRLHEFTAEKALETLTPKCPTVTLHTHTYTHTTRSHTHAHTLKDKQPDSFPYGC